MRFQRIIRVWALAGLLGGISLHALAQEEPADTGKPAALFEQLDADKDGKLTKEEVGQDRARFFDRMVRIGDKNEDGALTKEEFSAGSQPAERPAQPGDDNDRRTQFRARFIESIFKRSDSNGDGKLTLDEVPEQYKDIVRATFNQLGKKLDGALTLDEFQRGFPARQRPAVGREPSVRAVRVLDTNGDGKLSKEELSKAVEQFDKLDRDGDGQLDGEELSGLRVRPNPNPFQRPNIDQFINAFMERFDTDKDGKLSAKELADLPERGQERTKDWDGNKDGEVTKEEVTEALRRLTNPRREDDDRERRRPSRPESDD